MSSTERQRRFLERIRSQAAADAKAAMKANEPTWVVADSLAFRFAHLRIPQAIEWFARTLDRLGILEDFDRVYTPTRDAIRAKRVAGDQGLPFKVWLTRQPVTDDAAGDFIRDANADPQLPDELESWASLEAYLRFRQVDPAVIAAAAEVWNRYAELRAGGASDDADSPT